MLMTLLFAVFCLGFLTGRIVPGIARRVRDYLYVPRMLRAYQLPDSQDDSRS